MPIKLQLDADEELWKEVQKLRIDREFNSNNEAVIELIRIGLKSIKHS